MFTRFKRSTHIIFLDPLSSETIVHEKGKKLDIILSPKMYWVKKMSVPVSSVHEVKKLLPSIFEDSLPVGHYSYTAYKLEDEFLLFAYEDKKILDLIASKGISHTDIESVRFSQMEFADLESVVGVTDAESMYLKDSLVVLAPKAWFNTSKALELEEMKLSKHSIKLQQFGHIVDNKSLYKVGAVLVALALILIVEILLTNMKHAQVIESKEALFSKYKLQSTMIQNRSTYAKYSKIHTRQTKLRDTIAIFLKQPLQEAQKITSIKYTNKKLFVKISGLKKVQEKALLSVLDTKKLKYKTSFDGQSIQVEVSL